MMEAYILFLLFGFKPGVDDAKYYEFNGLWLWLGHLATLVALLALSQFDLDKALVCVMFLLFGWVIVSLWGEKIGYGDFLIISYLFLSSSFDLFVSVLLTASVAGILFSLYYNRITKTRTPIPFVAVVWCVSTGFMGATCINFLFP